MRIKKKTFTRHTKKTILFVGEGETEKAFLQHLKELFISRDFHFVIKVESGSGGGPKGVIQKAIRLKSSRAYDECFVLVDADRPLEKDKKLEERMKKKPSINLLLATPCIEGLFLDILEHKNFSKSSSTSDYCKREFEKIYMSANKKTDKRSYLGIFNKSIIEKQRSFILELDDILKAMQIGSLKPNGYLHKNRGL